MIKLFKFFNEDVIIRHTEDREIDNIKLSHELVNKAGAIVHSIDWSPYSRMSDETVELYLELGCPTRVGIGPLNLEDLRLMKAEQELKVASSLRKNELKQNPPQPQILIF